MLSRAPFVACSACHPKSTPFYHDPATNRLSLKECKRELWLRDAAQARGEKVKTWLYCLDCHSRYFETGKRVSGHLPFRDRASISSMRRPADKDVVETCEEPELEPAADTQPQESEEPLPELPLLDDVEEEAEEEEEVGDPLAEEDSPDPVDRKWPTLEEYQEKWASLLEQHSRPNRGEP